MLCVYDGFLISAICHVKEIFCCFQTFFLLHEEGFFVGASSGLNVAAAVKVLLKKNTCLDQHLLVYPFNLKDLQLKLETLQTPKTNRWIPSQGLHSSLPME